jgi:hypothetical protein
MRIPKSVLAVGSVVLAGGLFTVMNPRTVHAVAAALVQVTNTTSNPVPNSDVTTAPSQLVAISCRLVIGCYRMEPGGGLDLDAYVVPADQTLVITDVEIVTSGQSGLAEFALSNQGSGSGGAAQDPLIEDVANNGTTYHFSFSRGTVFPSGFPFVVNGTFGTLTVLRGYLVPNG